MRKLHQKRSAQVVQKKLVQATAHTSTRPKAIIGDTALDDLVEEEFKQNAQQERQRLEDAKQGGGWFGKGISNIFNYDGKSEIDILYHQVK